MSTAPSRPAVGAADRPSSGSHEALILAALQTAAPEGRTYEEIGAMTGLDKVAVARRLRTMAEKGLVHDTAARRLVSSGRRAMVWVAGPSPRPRSRPRRPWVGPSAIVARLARLWPRTVRVPSAPLGAGDG